MTERVRWTTAGRAALEAEASRGIALHRDTADAVLAKAVFAAAKSSAASWKRGLAKADAEGKAAVALAERTLVKGKLPTQPSVDDAARLLSLIGASESEFVGPLGELVIRTSGLPFAIAVAARMWSLDSESRNPDWPKSNRRRAIHIKAIEDDDDSVHDASCSYGKYTFTRYLQKRHRAGTPAERTQMKTGVDAIWKATTPHARPALAVATNDPKRAKQSALELIHAGESPWPYFAWNELPYLLKDAELALAKLGDGQLSLRLIENLGAAVWPLYAQRIAGRLDGTTRARLLEQLSNFYGPRTALLLAEYEDTKACAPIVRAYFTSYPELLDKVLDEPALAYHREDLAKLAAEISDRPGPDRPRS